MYYFKFFGSSCQLNICSYMLSNIKHTESKCYLQTSFDLSLLTYSGYVKDKFNNFKMFLGSIALPATKTLLFSI